MIKTAKVYGLSAMRVALLAACTGTLCTVPMLAQDPATPPPPPSGQVPGGPGGQGPGGPGRGGPEMQQRQLDMMTKQLNLTPDQVTRVKAIQDEGRDKMMAMRNDSSLSGDDRRAKMMTMRTEEQSKVKALLTDDQKTKYDAMMARQRERRQDGGGPPSPPPPPSHL